MMISSEVKSMIQQLKKLGVKVEQDESQMIVTELFTSSLPYISFIIFYEALADYMEMDKEELKKKFWKALVDTHFEYHRRMMRSD